MTTCKKCGLLPVQAESRIAKRMLKPSRDFCISCLRRVSEKKPVAQDVSAHDQVYDMIHRGEEVSAAYIQRKLGVTFSEAVKILAGAHAPA